MSTTGEASDPPCHINSPCQKLASRFEMNVQKPCGVKIGCGHHSPKGLCVQPRCAVFTSAPVKSPKLHLIHAIQQAAIKAGGKTSSVTHRNIALHFPDFA